MNIRVLILIAISQIMAFFVLPVYHVPIVQEESILALNRLLIVVKGVA